MPRRSTLRSVTAALAGLAVTAALVVGTAPPAPAGSVSVPALGAPAVLDPVPVVGSTAPAPTKAGLAEDVGPTLESAAFDSVGVSVVDPSDGSLLYGKRTDTPVAPASTLKILTALTALTVLGADTRLSTRVVRSGSTLILVGAGDGTLTRSKSTINGVPTASLDQLAASTAAVLKRDGDTAVRLGYDDSLFTGPRVSPEWSSTLVDVGVVGPVSALTVDRGRRAVDDESRSSDPAATAAAYFARALRGEGISVAAQIEPAVAAAESAAVAQVLSPSIAEIVEFTLTESDNDVAESLAHLAGAALLDDGSFEGGAAATSKVLEAYGIPIDGMSLHDGSGLARSDRVSPRTLTAALAAIATNAVPAGLTVTAPAGWAVATGLPIAGFTGTLADRFEGPATADAQGVVRAKTGTLTGVSSLAGTVVDADGRMLVFAALTTGADTDAARVALDRFAAELADCGCSG